MAQVVAGGGLGQVLKEGQVLADDGAIYTTVQEAQDAASDWIFIGPGTFQEAVTIDTAGLEVRGSGRDTLIDGGVVGTAIEVSATNVLIRNLSLQTTAGQGNSFRAVDATAGSSGGMVLNAWVRDCDSAAIITRQPDWRVVGCFVEASDVNCIDVGERCVVWGCVATGQRSGNAIRVTDGDDTLVESNVIYDVAGNGITVQSSSPDNVIAWNRVINPSGDGIKIDGPADCVVANNRISGSSTAINDGGTNTLLHGNRTGAAN